MHTTLMAAEGDENNPLAVEWPELALGLIVFAIVAALVAKFVVPNFEKAYSQRTKEIEGGIEEAQRAQREAKEALEKYNAQLADARHEASRIREEAKEQGAAIVAEMREQAQTEAERITASARAQVEAERSAVITQLRSEIGQMATDLASRIVGESLEDEARQNRTVERFISELERSDN